MTNCTGTGRVSLAVSIGQNSHIGIIGLIVILSVHNTIVIIKITQDHCFSNSLSAGVGNDVLIIGQRDSNRLGNIRIIYLILDVIDHRFGMDEDILAGFQGIIQL